MHGGWVKRKCRWKSTIWKIIGHLYPLNFSYTYSIYSCCCLSFSKTLSIYNLTRRYEWLVEQMWVARGGGGENGSLSKISLHGLHILRSRMSYTTPGHSIFIMVLRWWKIPFMCSQEGWMRSVEGKLVAI